MLFTTPIIRNLKDHFPHCTIAYLANARTADLLRQHPQVNQVFVYERDEFIAVYIKSKPQFLKKMLNALAEIRREKFDLVIDLSLNSYASFFMWAIGIPLRVGFNYKGRSPFLNKPVELKGYESEHVVEFYLGLLETLGLTVKKHPLEIFVPTSEQESAEAFFKNFKLAGPKNLVAFIPGGGASWGKDASFKRWPPEKYAKLADKIIEKLNVEIILMGDLKEKELCRRVASLVTRPVFDMSGTSTILQMAAYLKRCTLCIVNDGGPLHVAVAAGVKTVSIFGPVDEQVYGPWMPQSKHITVTKNIMCRPCYRNFRRAHCEHISCLNQLDVDEVFERIQTVLKNN